MKPPSSHRPARRSVPDGNGTRRRSHQAATTTKPDCKEASDVDRNTADHAAHRSVRGQPETGMSAPTITASAPNSTNPSDDHSESWVNSATAHRLDRRHTRGAARSAVRRPDISAAPRFRSPSIDTKPLLRHRGGERVDGLSSWSIHLVTPVALQNASGCDHRP